MSDYLPLSQLLTQGRSPDAEVAADEGGSRRWSGFSQEVARLSHALLESPHQRWALVTSDAYSFAVGFLGGLHGGKTLLLPPNAQPGTLRSLEGHAEGAISDLPDLPWEGLSPHLDTGPQAALGELSGEDLDIELFTSGSTGEARCIAKKLSHLEREVEVLERLWGAQLGDATIFSTASHQHIYGLLFRVCWPLAAGRCFWRPDMLNPGALCSRLQRGPSALISTPAHLRRALEWSSFPDGFPGLSRQLRAIFSSGGPLPARVARGFQEALGQAPLEVLGSSETGGVAWRSQGGPEGHVWTPLPEVQIQIDEASGGLLQVRSPFTPWGADRWYTMGDCASLADGGRFVLEGRKDRIVKIAEKRLHLGDMESRLEAHPWVREAAILRLVKGEESERLGCVVVLDDPGLRQLQDAGKRALNDAFKAHLSRHFDRVLLPRRWRYVEAIPQDAQGKRARRTLEAFFREEPV